MSNAINLPHREKKPKGLDTSVDLSQFDKRVCDCGGEMFLQVFRFFDVPVTLRHLYGGQPLLAETTWLCANPECGKAWAQPTQLLHAPPELKEV